MTIELNMIKTQEAVEKLEECVQDHWHGLPFNVFATVLTTYIANLAFHSSVLKEDIIDLMRFVTEQVYEKNGNTPDGVAIHIRDYREDHG